MWKLGLRPRNSFFLGIFGIMCPVCRQYWVDRRLQYNGTNMKELAMNWQFLSKIWRPDTYFLNGKDSYLHKIAVPNRSAMTTI
jgi:hypothetical protein